MKSLVSSKSVFIFSILIYVQGVLSASNSCSGSIQVKSEQDLESIRTCQTYEGSITIQNMTSEHLINLSQLQHIQGDLIFSNNPDLSQIVLASLRQVDGELKFQENQLLQRLDLTQLTSVKSLDISFEPSLDAILFPSGLSQIEAFTIKDTMASKIEGLRFSQINNMHIANNVYLNKINLNHLQHIGGAITVASNSPNLTLDLSSLTEIYQGDFRNLAELLGFNNVKKVSGDLSFESNSFDSLYLPNITEVVGTLTIANNSHLNNVTFPELKKLGGAVYFFNNTELKQLTLSKLEEVEGTVDITGRFDEVNLPSLTDVRGGLNVQTSSQQFSCDEINKFKGGVTKGHDFTCKNNVANPQSGLYNGQKDGSHQNSDTDSSGNLLTYSNCIQLITISTLFIIYLM